MWDKTQNALALTLPAELTADLMKVGDVYTAQDGADVEIVAIVDEGSKLAFHLLGLAETQRWNHGTMLMVQRRAEIQKAALWSGPRWEGFLPFAVLAVLLAIIFALLWVASMAAVRVTTEPVGAAMVVGGLALAIGIPLGRRIERA